MAGNKLECPSCRIDLKEEILHGKEAATCPKCSGFALSQGDMLDLVKSVNKALEESGGAAELADTVATYPDGIESCPFCSGTLESTGYMGGNDIILKLCDPCRLLWLTQDHLIAMACQYNATEKKRMERELQQTLRNTAEDDEHHAAVAGMVRDGYNQMLDSADSPVFCASPDETAAASMARDTLSRHVEKPFEAAAPSPDEVSQAYALGSADSDTPGEEAAEPDAPGHGDDPKIKPVVGKDGPSPAAAKEETGSKAAAPGANGFAGIGSLDPAIVNLVYDRIRHGDSPAQVAARLQGHGMSPEDARVAMKALAEEYVRLSEEERIDGFGAIAAGLVAGLMGAAIGAAGWGYITTATGREIGYAAWAIGLLTGFSVLLGSGGKRGLALQMVSALTAALGVAAGKYFCLHHYLVIAVSKQQGAKIAAALDPFSSKVAEMILARLKAGFTHFDAIWIVLAVITAWSIPKRRF